jgi:hypothetical protein
MPKSWDFLFDLVSGFFEIIGFWNNQMLKYDPDIFNIWFLDIPGFFPGYPKNYNV